MEEQLRMLRGMAFHTSTQAATDPKAFKVHSIE